MNDLKTTIKENPERIETYKVSGAQIDEILEIINKEKALEDYLLLNHVGTDHPVYLAPYGERIFITAEGELVLDSFSVDEEDMHDLELSTTKIYRGVKELLQ